MGTLICLFSVLTVLYLGTINNQRKTNSRLIQTLFCFSLLVMIQGLRHSTIGIDSCNIYRPYFESVSYGLTNIFDFGEVPYGFEKGFVLFTKLVKTLFNNTQFYIFLCSIVSIAPIAYLIYKYADNIPLAFIVFSTLIVYHFGFSGIRQAMAIGITCVAFEFLLKKKPLPFIIVTLIAFYFHTSALLFLIAYPLYHYLKLTPVRLLFLGICFIIVLFFLQSFIVFLTDLIFGGEKYLDYIMKDTVPSYNLMILFTAILLFTFMVKNERITRLRVILLMAVVFQSLGLLSSAASRMAYYFIPYISLAIPITTNSTKLKIPLELSIILLMILFYIYCNASGYLDVIPYKFYWE